MNATRGMDPRRESPADTPPTDRVRGVPRSNRLSCPGDGERVFHTYSNYARGAEMTGGSYYWLDLTPLGRQEDWEEGRPGAAGTRSAVPDFAS